MKTKCSHCDSRNLSWFCQMHNKSEVAEGRLRTNDVDAQFVLGCDECSETLQVLTGDEVAALLNRGLVGLQAA